MTREPARSRTCLQTDCQEPAYNWGFCRAHYEERATAAPAPAPIPAPIDIGTDRPRRQVQRAVDALAKGYSTAPKGELS